MARQFLETSFSVPYQLSHFRLSPNKPNKASSSVRVVLLLLFLVSNLVVSWDMANYLSNMVPASPSIKSVRHVDFFAHKETAKLRPFEPLRETLQPILKLLQSYRVILGCNGSIAKHLEIPLFSSRIKARINESFSNPRPHIVEMPDGRCGPPPSWTDLIREAFSEDQFEFRDDNAYRYCIGGILVETSRADRDLLCSGLLRKLLQGRTDPEDLQKEYDSRFQVISDLIRLNKDALEGE